MSNQPKDNAGLPDDLVKELLRSQGLPLDAHVEVNVHTTRVRLNPDGTRTVLSSDGQSTGSGRFASTRRTTRIAAMFIATLGFIQMGYGMWASHSDTQAAGLIHRSASCQLPLRAGGSDSTATPTTVLATPTCRIEPATVLRTYRGSSRSGSSYHVVSLRPDGSRDDIRLTARQSGRQLWNRLRPMESIHVQRFLPSGYHLSREVLALADSAGTAMSRGHPDSGAYANAASAIAGGLMFAVGLAMFATKPGRRA